MKPLFPASLVLLAACSRPSAPLPVFELPFRTATESGFVLRSSELSLRPPNLNAALDLNWLDLAGFYPPGAERIGGGVDSPLPLAPEARVRFPSVQVARSPDQQTILFHDGLPRGSGIQHWLLLLNSKEPEPRTVLGTTWSFDAMWAPNSRFFAVTTYPGDNSSKVSLHGLDGARHDLDVREFLRARYPEHLWEAPVFVKAYRWTHDSLLVVRALGKSPTAPHDIFGGEAIAFVRGEGTRLHFLRGFVKWAEQAAQPASHEQTPR